MSTLPGLASKGEKGKSKFQSLDINNLYKVYTTEPLETHQQKNTLPRKHGMQSLGKVPTARRPPANLPSLKSEHTGSDAAVSLVPSGGAGWGKQEQNPPSANIPAISTTTNSNVTTSSSPAIVQQNAQPTNALPASSLPQPNKTHPTPTATPVTADKSWSSVMSGADLLQPPPYQSPQFQHEFPSLSAGDGALPRTGVDTQYGPGPSLRPQTEGSWIQGGSRSGTEVASRNNSAPQVPPPQLSAQAGQNQQQQQPPQPPLPPQFRGLIPPFMFRGNNFPPSNGHGNSNFSNVAGTANNGRNRLPDNRGSSRSNDSDELCHRPIIREEDLNKMDDMTRDVGWASHDDIDYNQKLAFSDDEPDSEKHRRHQQQLQLMHKEHHDKIDMQEANKACMNSVKTGSSAQNQVNRNRTAEEDEVWIQRRRQQSEEVAIVIERAKQRKEEEEKRFLEIRQAAAKKLQQLDEKRNKHDKEIDDNQGTINPSSVPPQPINPVPIPVPDWEKEKERSRTPVENKPQYRENNNNNASSDFRKLTQIEGRSFQRKENRSADRDSNRERERDAPIFSKQFQSNLPPRFQKRHQMRNNPSPQPPANAFSEYDIRWQNQIKPEPRKRDDEIDVKDLDDRRKTSDDYRSGNYRSFTGKIDEDGEFEYRKDIVKQEEQHNISRQNSDDNRIVDRFERPQRPDSRDSRASRESRHSRDSDTRDYHGSWADAPFEPFDDKRKDHFREDRRAVPGPITKERIEAEDFKSEKKNLTQLKRGYIPEKRISEPKKEEDKSEKWEEDEEEPAVAVTKPNEKDKEELVSNAWADSVTNSIPEEKPKEVKDEKLDDESEEKADKIPEKDKDDKGSIGSIRRRNEPRRQQQPWGNACVYHRSSWSKKSDARRGSRNGALKKPLSKNNEWHGTDSDVSVDEVSVSTESGKEDRLRTASKKLEKDEKNKETKHDKFVSSERKFDSNRRDNYVPRGEPSRHGRGASNIRSRGGLSKRIDGYGPPPSKSPFSQLEDREKKNSDESVGTLSMIPIDGVISEDKIKDGIPKIDDAKKTKKAKSDDNCDTSDNSEDNGKFKRFGQKTMSTGTNRSSSAVNVNRRSNPPPRLSVDKRSNYNSGGRQNSNGSLKSYGMSKKDKDIKDGTDDFENIDGELEVADSDGFQEVKSKKAALRQKPFEDKMPMPRLVGVKSGEKDKMINKKSSSAQLTPQQIANIPSLMDTPVNPPTIAPQTSSKNQFERSFQNRLPPRFARQRENRLQKAHMQQQGMCDVNEMNKVNHNINMYGMKDGQGSNAGRMSNAWDKPLSTHLRTEQDGMLSVGIDSSKTLEQPQPPSQSNSPNIDKVMKPAHVSEKTVLDGATPPVNTIIFENTNFKSAPGARVARSDKASCPTKLEETGIEQAVISSFNKPMRDLLNKNEKSSESIQMQLSFAKEDNSDIKLDFFESELSHLTDDKTSKTMGLPRSMHITNANNTISASTADALNFKIASVKKVWETMPTTALEHSVGQDDTNSSFSASFGPDPNSLDPSNAFGKGGDNQEDGHEPYSTAPNQPTTNNTPNVCKVKPTQQVTGTSGQPVHSASTHQQHSGIGPGIVGHPLSPPPMQPVLGAGVGLGQPPQPYTSNQHLGYQPNLGGSTQYGMSAIPSPPTVLFNSTQQIQAAQSGLYGAFQIDQSQVLGGQGRSQYSPYANPYNLGQTASSPYSAQSMYLQGQPHPSAAQAPPDLYQNISNYRLPATGPFGQNQQLNNPTTVLISSTSNSLMSATVKPSTQQISAIGTKASTGQAYQQQSQQGQLYMTYDPTIPANYLPSTGVLQRGPTAAPLQNNVVPAMQPSSSYYTGSTGAQNAFYQQPTSSTLQSASLQQHQAGYGLQGNVFGNPNQSHTSAGLQNFGSHFLSSPMQMAAAAAMNAQQYRSNSLQNSAYVKAANNHIDQNTRPQQIKSPGSQQDVLSSVFNSGSQIPSPKSRQNMKQPQPQASPTTQHKYLYQAVGNQPTAQNQRYPPPIQRPVNFHTAVGAVPNNNSNNPKHRSTNQSNKLAARHYYGNQGGNLSTTQTDKGDDSKLVGDGTAPNSSISSTSNIVSKTVNGNSSTSAVSQTAEKETAKDDAGVIKD